MSRKGWLLLAGGIALCALVGLAVNEAVEGGSPIPGPESRVPGPSSGPVATRPLPVAASQAFDPNDPDVKLLVKGINEFAIDLYKEIAKNEKGNIFFSPFSISSALAMTYAGARGKTADEMAKVMHFPPELTKDNGKRLNAAFGKLIAHLNPGKGSHGKQPGYNLITANALWVQVGYPFLEGFIRINKEYYDASIQPLDFVREREISAKRINKWVANKTGGRIPEIIAPGTLEDGARLVLTNAVCFKGVWEEKFDRALTRRATFLVSGSKKAEVEMMTHKGSFRWIPKGRTFEDRDSADPWGVELPYCGGICLAILVPPEGLSRFRQGVTGASLNVELEGMISGDVMVSLPKFTISWSGSICGHLGGMGIREALQARQADFSGMDGRGDLFLSRVEHHGVMISDEDGTEAAAGVAAAMELRVRPPVFTVDRPFFFVIKSGSTGCILFVGQIQDPRGI